MQESIMSAETLEEGDANTLNLINSLVTAEEEQHLHHTHQHHHHDFTELTDNHFLGDHHSTTTPTLSDTKQIDSIHETHSMTDEEHIFNFNLGGTPTNQPHRDDDSSHHLVGNFDSTTSTPLTSTNQPVDERERLLKRIGELEEQVRLLFEENKQKTDTINVLSQHNIELTYQLQVIQYYHPDLLAANPTSSAGNTNPTPNSPLMLSPNQHANTTSPLFSNFPNSTSGINPSPQFSPGVLSSVTSPITSPMTGSSGNTPNMSNTNGISPNLQPSLLPSNPGYYPIHPPHILPPTTLIPPSAKNGIKKKKKKSDSPAINASSFQSPLSSTASPSTSIPIPKKQAKKKRKIESDGEETSESEDDTPDSSTSTPSNPPPVNTTHLPPPPTSNLPPKPKVTLPPQPSKYLPKLPPRSLVPGMDPFSMHSTTPFPFPPPSTLPHPTMGLGEHGLMMDPILQHHMGHHEPPSPGTFSPIGGVTETPGGTNSNRRRSKKSEAMDTVMGMETVDTVNPSNVETEIKKLFSKVNNGGKRGILAVHAGDGLDTVKEAIKQTLDQVEVLKNRAVSDYNSRKEASALNCINKALNLLYLATRGIVGGLLQLLESSISQLLDGTRDNWGLDIAKLMEKSWLDLFSVIFVDSDITCYTQLGTLVDSGLTQSCLEELQSFGKSLSYFKFDHLTRVFNLLFGYLKKNNTVDWYLNFCLQIRYYKEYCAKMIELNHYEECFNNIVNIILTGNVHAVRTGDYKDEDKTYLVEFAVQCLTKIYDNSVEIVKQEYIDNHIEDSVPINLSNTHYSEMLEKIMGNCVNIQKIVLYPRELVPLLRFLLKVFPSEEAFVEGGGLGETRQDIRHLTFIADLLFIMSRFIGELDEYNETIDSVKAVGRKIVLECTDSLLQKLIRIKHEGNQTHLKEILETNDLFKMSIAQICEKAVWIPIHQEEKDYNWKALNDYNETLQIKQDEVAITIRGKLLEHLKLLLPGVSQYLTVMIDAINYALNYKIENRSNTSYEQFFNVMKKIGVHYLQSQREAQWEELLAKIYFIHSRKVKLKKMLKQWNTEFKSKMETNVNWYDQLLGESGYLETEPLIILPPAIPPPRIDDKPPVPLLTQSVNNPNINHSSGSNSNLNGSSSTSVINNNSGLTTQTLKRRKTKLVRPEEGGVHNGGTTMNNTDEEDEE